MMCGHLKQITFARKHQSQGKGLELCYELRYTRTVFCFLDGLVFL
jgi:hypothetical protein